MGNMIKPAARYIHELSNSSRRELYDPTQHDETVQVIYSEDFKGWDTDTRRPYYRIRGPRITKEQAFDIIARTDRVFGDVRDKQTHNYIRPEKHVWIQHLDNNWFDTNVYPNFSGCWCHPDGTIGTDSHIVDTYPLLADVLDTLYPLACEFPYLDFVWAITKWNEVPDRLWDKAFDTHFGDEVMLEIKQEKYPDFSDNIDITFYLHDKKIEILEGQRGRALYEEYNVKYGGDEEKFRQEYYAENGCPVDLNYFRKCVAANDLDYDSIEFGWSIIEK